MGWVDSVKKFLGQTQSGNVAELTRGNSGEAIMPRGYTGSSDSGMAARYGQLSTMLAVDADLMLRFADYEAMDDYGEICAALDIYADDATIPDSVHGKVIWGLSRDRVVRDIIDDLLHRRLRIEDDIWTAIRTMCKYGNLACELVMNENGILGLNWLPPPTVRRVIDDRGMLIGYIQDPSGGFAFSIATKEELEKLREKSTGSNVVFFYPWEIVHWRLRGKNMRALYGSSVLDSARWVWKRLVMLEDSGITNKLTKAPSRFAFYIDTGDLPPREAKAVVDDVRRRYKKKKVMDPSTGRLDYRFNPLAIDEDFFVPSRAGKDATRIDVLSGPDYDDTGIMGYFLKKLYASLRVPPQYLGGTEVTNRAALSQEDVQFGRFELRIQREFLLGMNQVVRVHLAALGIDPDAAKWSLKMPAPSSIFEMQQVEVWSARAGLAAALRDFFTTPWIMANIFHLSDEDALFAAEAKRHEVAQESLLQAQSQADIMQRYPEVAGMQQGGGGGMGGGMPGMGGGGGQPQQMAPESVLRNVDKALDEVSSDNGEILRNLRRLGPAVDQIGRRVSDLQTRQINEVKHGHRVRP